MGSRAYDCNLSYNDIVHELCGSFRLLKTRDTIWKNAACQFKVDRQRAIPLRQLSLFIMPLATRDIKQCCDLSTYPSLLRPVPIWERSVVMSVSVCVWVFICPRSYLRNHVRSSLNFLCMLPMAVAQSFSGGVMICYVRPVYGWRHICS